MSSSSRDLEKIGTRILAVLTIIATITGILSFVIGDLGLFRGATTQVSDVHIEETLVALQLARMAAELQLTQVALDNQQSANLATQTTIAQQGIDLAATLEVVGTQQAAVIATSNAAAAMTATANAVQELQNATATQSSLDATATALFLEQTTPTPTSAPSPTPLPTETPIPEVVRDFRRVASADISPDEEGRLLFTINTQTPIPEDPPENLAYRWGLDTDFDPTTGLAQNDIGVDMYVRVYYIEGAWLGMVRSLNAEGEETDTFRFADVSVSGREVVATLIPAEVGLPTSFYWIAQAFTSDQTFAAVPSEGHYILALP